MKKREKTESATQYEEALKKQAAYAFGSGVHGIWAPYPKTPPPQIHSEIRAIETSGHLQPISENHGIRVFRAQMFGIDTLIREFDLKVLKQRCHYLFRISHGRRLWAASRTLRKLEIPTPKPLGFLDVRDRGIPRKSYAFTEFMPEMVSARDWLRHHYDRQTPELKSVLRREFLHVLLNLYRVQVYHNRTHCGNLLLRAPEDPRMRAFYWIDVEALEFGVTPTRSQIIGNLVQINETLGRGVPESDRLAFLRAMAREHPWLNDPKVMKEIRTLTRERLTPEHLRAQRR